MLRQEPEFEEYCMSVSEDIATYRKLKAVFISRGYPEAIIEEGFSAFWQESM